MDKKRSWIRSSFYSVLILDTGDLYLKKMAESEFKWDLGSGDNPKYKFHLIDAERVIQNTHLLHGIMEYVQDCLQE